MFIKQRDPPNGGQKKKEIKKRSLIDRRIINAE